MAEANKNDITVLAETNYRDYCRLFGIRRDDRRRHMYVIGKTGMGKSELLKQMIYSDIMAGQGLSVVDPHGDLAEQVLDFVPSHRVNDVIYFNPADLDFPIAFNILETVNPEVRHLVASGLIGVFKKIWADSWGPRLEYVLRNAILALLDYPGSTLLGIMRILTDKTYRKKVLEKVKDPVVRGFWIDEYSKYPDKFQAEAIAPIQNKVGQFLSNALIRNVVGQVKSSIDIRDVMDTQKILILNLSKGRIGEDTSALLGAMMITQLQLAAMARVDMPEEDRKDFYLYVDEFQNFATESFANILSEARKYRLALIIAHQYIEQLDEKVAAAVFGNVGTIVCFRVGAADAEVLVKEFTPYFTEEDLVNLPKWQIYLKLMVNGVASTPFSANTLKPVSENFGNREKIIRVTRERYAKPRDVIEDKISRWATSLETAAIEEHKAASAMPPRADRGRPPMRPAGGAPSSTPRPRPPEERTSAPRPVPPRREPAASPTLKPAIQQTATAPAESVPQPLPKPAPKVMPSSVDGAVKPARKKEAPRREPRSEESREESLPFSAICSSCGKETRLSFEPDGKRPVYCKECLKKVREERRAVAEGGEAASAEPSSKQEAPAVTPQAPAVASPAPQTTVTDPGRPVGPGETIAL